MREKHVLFLGLCGIIRFRKDIDYFRNCISDLNINITSVEQHDFTLLSDFGINIVLTKSDYGDEELFSALNDINAKNPFDAIICFSENLVQLTALLIKRFDLPGNSVNTSIKTTNKFEMRKALRIANVQIPEFYKVSSKSEAIQKACLLGYPCIIKPVQQYFSRGVMKIESESELVNFFDWTMNISGKNTDVGYILIEQYIDGKEYSAEVIVNNGKILFVGFTEKFLIDSNFRDEISHIHPFYFDEEKKKMIMVVLEKTIKAVGVNSGGCHIEFKIYKNNIYIIEIASRLGGGGIPLLVKLSTNVDMINMVIKIALKEEVILPQKKEYYAGIRFVTCNKDCEITTSGLSKELLSVPGIINAGLLFEQNISIKVENSGCERIGFIIARNRDKQKLIESLEFTESIIKKSLNYIFHN